MSWTMTRPDTLHHNTFNIAQDIIYLAFRKQKLTPKHIGLGLNLHQATSQRIKFALWTYNQKDRQYHYFGYPRYTGI